MKVDVPIEMGKTYRDQASGFSGVAVGIWIKWGGQVQVSLTRIGQDGKPYETWFDLVRLEETSTTETSGAHV